MWYISIFDAKENVSREEIRKEREEWIKKGKDKVFHQKCRTINRYEVIGRSPLKIIFVIETDDPYALIILSRHFGDGWNSVTYPMIQREIYEALEEDTTIIGG
ncbi:MAG: hypothetical protein HZA07_00825 [Nitrospirae bacterium]|nr:hypothetical protein [Nitrospirota bacterium]